jgi:3',5'-cyclic AMP phosphodiesterase CpdA
VTALLHLSDTHFGTAQADVVQALVRLVRAQAPGLAVLSGDVTQRATRAQFAEARAFIERLGIPNWVKLPGNHDIPLFDVRARLFAPYARYREALGSDLAPAADVPPWRVFSVNTTRWYRHKHGEISREQVEHIARELRSAMRSDAQQIRVVVVHQPVAVQHAADESNLLRGSAHALRQWAEAGADLVLGGHIHLPFAVPLHERQPLARPLWAVQAGTAVSSRVRPGAPNSVNLLHAQYSEGQRRCLLQRWDYAAASGEFGLVREDLLDLAPATASAVVGQVHAR